MFFSKQLIRYVFLIFVYNPYPGRRCKRISLHMVDAQPIRAKLIFSFQNLVCLISLMIDLAQLTPEFFT